jgi:hypothetical protein
MGGRRLEQAQVAVTGGRKNREQSLAGGRTEQKSAGAEAGRREQRHTAGAEAHRVEIRVALFPFPLYSLSYSLSLNRARFGAYMYRSFFISRAPCSVSCPLLCFPCASFYGIRRASPQSVWRWLDAKSRLGDAIFPVADAIVSSPWQSGRLGLPEHHNA